MVAESTGSRRRRALAVVAGAFGSLDTSVNVAFPAIAEAFDLAVADLQWIVVTYVLTYGALLVAAGRLGDSFGHHRIVRIGALVSLLGLGACAAAPGYAVFLVGRVVQGLGAALVMAGAPALLTTAAGDGRGRAVGLFQTAAMVGLAIGPIVGGPLIEIADWRAVYWFRLPVAAALFVLASGVTRAGKDRGAEQALEADSVEIALNAAALGGIVAVISLGRTWGWTSGRLLALAAVALGVTAMAMRRAATTAHPTIDRRALERPGFLGVNLLTATANGAMFPIWLLVPSLLVDGFGHGVIASGFVLAVSAVGSSLASKWAGDRIDDGRPRRLAVAGLLAEAAGMATVAVSGPAASTAGVVAGLALTGIGLGLFTVPNMHEVMSALPGDRQGVAGGLSLMMRTLGIVGGVAVASAVFDPIEEAAGFDTAFAWVFAGSAVALGLAAIAMAKLPDSTT